MLIKIAIVVVILLVVLIVLISRQPDEFRVSRTTTINAKPAAVFEQVNTSQSWKAWSPWVKLDPNAAFTYSGPASGVGSATYWSGNKNIGEGSSTITESTPDKHLTFRLEFIRPMKAVNTTEFTFQPEGDGTNVTWTMYGPTNFISKAIGLIMNCEKMVGDQFNEGLNNLKHVVETSKS